MTSDNQIVSKSVAEVADLMKPEVEACPYHNPPSTAFSAQSQ